MPRLMTRLTPRLPQAPGHTMQHSMNHPMHFPRGHLTDARQNIARLSRLALAALLWLAAAGLAHAQYVWIDEKGVRHYSDRPPESNVPASRILKSPAAPEAKPGSDASKGAPPADSSAASLAQKNADFKKRRGEQQEKEKTAAEDAARKSARNAACERLAQYQKTLASGERITQPGQNGERNFLTEEQKTAEMKENTARLNDCKNAQ